MGWTDNLENIMPPDTAIAEAEALKAIAGLRYKLNVVLKKKIHDI